MTPQPNNTDSFSFDAAVERWRLELQQRMGLSASDIQELEVHLRDSMAALQARGLSDVEAFLIARRRLGQPDELEAEFQRADPVPLMRERALWMIVGSLVLAIGSGLTNAFGLLSSVFLALAHFVPETLWPWSVVAVRLTAFFGLVFLWSLSLKPGSAFDRMLSFGRSHPWRLIWCLVGIEAVVWGCGIGVSILSVRLLPIDSYVSINRLGNYHYFVQVFLLPVLIFWIARRRAGESRLMRSP